MKMTKLVRLCFHSIMGNKKNYAMIVLQLGIILLLVNLLLASINNRIRYYRPYQTILQNKGCTLMLTPGTDSFSEELFMDWESQNFKPLLEKLSGEADIQTMCFVDNGADDPNKQMQMIGIPDDLYDQLEIPLQWGGYSEMVATEDAFQILKKQGMQWDSTHLNITGILTEHTYQPSWNQYSDKEEGVVDFYESYQSGSPTSSQSPFVIVRESWLRQMFSQEQIFNMANIFITYRQCSEKQWEQDKKTLQTYGMVKDYALIDRQSREWIKTDIEQYFPIIVCTLVVVIIGFVLSVCIDTKVNIREMCIYTALGASRSTLCVIRFMETAILLCMAAALAALSYVVFFMLDLSNEKWGLCFQWNNIYFSILLFAGLFIVVSIFPLLLICREKKLIYES